MPATISVIGGLAQAALPGVKSLTIANLAFTFGAYRENSDGSPAVPCLGLKYPGTYSFAWGVEAGTRMLAVNVKQAGSFSSPPTMTIKANTALGLNSDVVGTAARSASWVTIGPVTAVAGSNGVFIVQLVSNATAENAAPCLWDHIVTT
jgi:hypothetical protein